MKKSAGIIILIVWFIWSTGRDLYTLLTASTTAEFYIFSSNGLTPLFFVFALGIFLLDAATVFYLFQPRPVGFYVALSALGLSLLQSIVSMSLTLSDLSGVREAYVASREARGLSVREEALDMMFTPAAMYLIFGVIVVITAVAAFLIIRNRSYFLRRQG